MSKLFKKKPKSPSGVTMLYGTGQYSTPEEAAAAAAPTQADVEQETVNAERTIAKRGRRKLSTANTVLSGNSGLS